MKKEPKRKRKRGSLTKGQQCQTAPGPPLLLSYPKTKLNFIQADYLQTPIQSTLDYTILCYITFRFLYFYCIVLYVQFPVTVTVLRVIYSQTKEKNVLFHNEKNRNRNYRHNKLLYTLYLYINVYPIIVNNMYVKLYKTHAPGYSQPIKRAKKIIFCRILLIVFYVILIIFSSLASKQTICLFLLFKFNLCTVQNLWRQREETRRVEEKNNKTLKEEEEYAS